MNQYTVWILVYVVFCCVAAEFFIVGCFDNSSGNETIQDVAWVVEDQESSTVFYALQLAFHDGDVEGVSVPYQECADTFFLCSTFGRKISADALAIMSLMMFGFLVHSSRQATTFYSANPKIKIICITLVVLVVALVAFMCECYHEVDDVDADWVWGPESVLSLVSLLLAVCAKVRKLACREQYGCEE